MSDSYASRLSEYKNKGVCGLPEIQETKRSKLVKMKKLVELVKNAHRVVIITGAGISTSAGIPDFRGPHGIWTKEKQEQQAPSTTSGNKRKRPTETPATKKFCDAEPTLTHRAVTKLAETGKVTYCITQNVDGLHRRAGLSRSSHASVHGCVFTEVCENPNCGAEHFRDHEVGGMSFQKTGRQCTLCNGDLRDTLLDWEDPLPEDDLDRAQQECEEADLILCLGTSLRIVPVGNMPLLGKKFAIVNLQETPHDQKAAVQIRAPVDDVMNELLVHLVGEKWDDQSDVVAIERTWVPPKKSG